MLWLKDESRNPTWSHKDRAMTVAVTAAQAMGHRTVVGASTGNAGASLAAYAARAGMHCVMFTGTDVPQTMQTFMAAYGALLCLLDGGANRRAIAALGIERYGWFPGTNVTDPPVGSNPYGVEGYTTIAYEIVRDLGEAPAAVVVPTSYGDNLTGIWRGFNRLRDAGIRPRPPDDRGGTGELRAVRPRAGARRAGADSDAADRRLLHRRRHGEQAGLADAPRLDGRRGGGRGTQNFAVATRLARETGLYLEAASVVGVEIARGVAGEHPARSSSSAHRAGLKTRPRPRGRCRRRRQSRLISTRSRTPSTPRTGTARRPRRALTGRDSGGTAP